MLTGYAIIALALGIFGAALNLLAALFVKDGRWPLRMFAFAMCVAVAAAYSWLIAFLSPAPLPPMIGRALFSGLLAVSSAWAGVDLYVWFRGRHDSK